MIAAERSVPDGRPAVPRAIAALIIGAIALASLAALVWPELPFGRTTAGQPGISVVTRQLDTPAAGGVVGRAAPDFEWATPDGRTLRLSDLRGTPVVVNFWATWCVPCRAEMPALERAARADGAIQFLAVDLDEDSARIRSFFDQLALERLQPLLDVSSQTARRFGVVSLPTTFFVDRDGVVRHLELGGPMTDDVIRKGLAVVR